MSEVQYVFLSTKDETKFRILHGINRSIDKMSVSEICENCHISRPTFYAHFDSKYAVADWFFDLAASLYLEQIGRTLTWDCGVAGYFSFLYRERECLQFAFVENPRKSEIERKLEARKAAFMETVQTFKGVEPDEDVEFYVTYFARSGNRLAIDWCLDGMPYGPEKFARFFTDCMPGPLVRMLNEDAE